MSPKLERFLNRLFLTLIASSAIALADAYHAPASVALYFLGAVALGGLLAPIPTVRPDAEPADAQQRRRR